MMNYFSLLLFTFLSIRLSSQTIIMNEVSNGPSGNQEYVEFVVVSNTVTYNCNNAAPPCIDIRGWIFDDNSGLHGGTSGTGVAPGAIRFSQSSVWSCVPLGTIILIYNNLDRNPAIPPDDISMADGNCTIIAPVSNAALFETNTTTPGAVACSYPATGWTAVGSWTTTLLANTGDCARIVNLAGCEVFSVCYGTANTNNLIYFSGAGGQKVFYFNDVDPSIQANWTGGSASPSPGNQTPGAPNNAANAAYIAQFNNGCMPITPIAIGTATSVNAGCTCDGSATINASGSIGPYTYVWYDASFNPIGQTGATANGLCAGVYKVIATSHIGCSDTTSVTISSTGSAITLAVNSETTCAGTAVVLTATPSIAGGTYSWSPGGQTTQTISVGPVVLSTYVVTYTLGGCSGSANATVTVNSSPTLSLASTAPSLCASGQTATLSLSGSTGTYSWSNGATTSTTSVTSPGVYMATVTTSSCGTATATVSIATLPQPTISVSAPSTSLCTGSSIVLTANSSDPNYLWSNGITTQTVSVNSASISVTTTNSCGSTSATQTIDIVPLPTLTVSPGVVSLCAGQSVTLQANTHVPVTYSWSTGAATNTVSLNSAGVYTVDVSSLCGNATGTVSVTLSSVPTITAAASTTLICGFGNTATLSAPGSTGTYLWSNGATTSVTTVLNSGVYTVTLTNSCGQAISSISVTTLPMPTVAITPQGGLLCPGKTGILTANSTNAGNFSWSTGAVATNTISITTPGVYSVTASNLCGTKTATAHIGTATMTPIVITPSSYSICPNETATLTATGGVLSGFGASSYAWSNSTTTDLVNTTSGGVVTLSVTNLCGIYTESIAVNVNSVTAVIAAVPISGTSPLTVNFTNNSTGASTYLWDFGNGNTANTQTVSSQTYVAEGEYTVYLFVTNGACADLDSVIITVFREIPEMTIPNVFTPNGDHVNDVFKITAFSIVDFNCTIFDRWGLQLYTWNDVSKGWDGTVNGKLVPEGTYFYILSAKDIQDKETKKQGTVNLFK